MKRRKLSSFLFHCAGVAAIEFVFVLPVLMLLLFGGVELVNYIVIQQRVEKAVYTLTDIVTQHERTEVGVVPTGDFIDNTKLQNVLDRLGTLLAPYGADARQRVIMTSVSATGCNASGGGCTYLVNWQEKGGGSLDAGVSSVVNSLTPVQITPSVAGTPATFNASINAVLNTNSMPAGVPENFIVGEVFYAYEPIALQALSGLGFSIQPRTIIGQQFLAPRNGVLTCLPPQFAC